MSEKADEVFEFLDSLPQEKTGGKGANNGSPKDDLPCKGTKKGKVTKDEDIFEFLDELEKTNINKDGKTYKANKSKSTIEEEPIVVDENHHDNKKNSVNHEKENSIRESSEPLNDPITSISNWWSSSGSTKVTSIWNKTTEHANIIKDRVVKEAANTNLPPINNLINNQQLNEMVKNLQKIVVGDTDEVLRIHLVHDLINLPQLTFEFHDKFDQVLATQVQGGIRIFVDEWGKPNGLDQNNSGNNNENNIKNNNANIQLNVFEGKTIEAEKLSFANLDESIKLFNKAHEEIMKQQKEQEKEQGQDKQEKDKQEKNTNVKENVSDIFISILPVSVPKEANTGEKGDIHIVDSIQPGCFNFTLILKDITNDIKIITRSQGYPMKWAQWLESNKLTIEKKNDVEEIDVEDIDPSEWVNEWIMDGLNLTIGVLAQNYVIERMGYN